MKFDVKNRCCFAIKLFVYVVLHLACCSCQSGNINIGNLSGTWVDAQVSPSHTLVLTRNNCTFVSSLMSEKPVKHIGSWGIEKGDLEILVSRDETVSRKGYAPGGFYMIGSLKNNCIELKVIYRDGSQKILLKRSEQSTTRIAPEEEKKD